MDIWDYFNQIDVEGYNEGLGECIREAYRSLTFTWHGAARLIGKACKYELLKEPKILGKTNVLVEGPARKITYQTETATWSAPGDESEFQTVPVVSGQPMMGVKLGEQPSPLRNSNLPSGRTSNNPRGPDTNISQPELIRPFENFLANLKRYTMTLETFAKEIFYQLSADIKKNPCSADNKPYPQMFIGQVEDIIRERMEYMDNLDLHESRHQKMKNTFKRQSEDILGLVHELINDNDQKVRATLIENKRNDPKVVPVTPRNVTLSHLNGKLKYKGQCDRAQLPHGTGSQFHYNGNLEFKGEFLNGKMTGDKCKVNHFNGNLQYQGPIKDGLYDGDGKLMHENGQLRYKGVFEKSKPHQENAKLYYDNGQLDYKGDITNGIYDSEHGQSYYRNGVLEYEGMFKGGGPHGEDCSIYYKNGKIWYRGSMNNRMFDGHGTLYGPDGFQEFCGQFHQGKPVAKDSVFEIKSQNRERYITDKIKGVL